MRRLQVFWVFLRLGLTSFGGPVAHLGYFHREFVRSRQWLSEQEFSDLLALSQFLPGPASSQLGMAIGVRRAGLWGALAAWLGFTLPSALILIAFGFGVLAMDPDAGFQWIKGVKVAVVAIVAHAVWSMAKNLCDSWSTRAITLAVAAGMILWPVLEAQLLFLLVSGVVGVLVLKDEKGRVPVVSPQGSLVSRRMGVFFLTLFFALLILTPFLATHFDSMALRYFESFYRSGALVFGGGHVILPLLHTEIVNPGWISNESFLAGYGAAQAIPGPLFAFSAYLGTVMQFAPNGVLGAVLCLVAAFLPSVLLILGFLPFWQKLLAWSAARPAVAGINAGVVGLLLAALYTPVGTSGIHDLKDVIVASVFFLLLVFSRTPAWALVGLGALLG